MKKLIFIALMLTLATACNRGFEEVQIVPGPAGTPGAPGAPGRDAPVTTLPTVDATQADIDALIKDENEYRLGLGQTVLTGGLSCYLYTITSGDRIQATIPGHNTLDGFVQIGSYTYKGEFNQPNSSANDGMNVLPLALRNVYKNMYMLRCQGQIVVQTSDYYSFELASDDASVFYLDGSKVIDNDNNHGVTLVTGQKFLRRGVHSFRLDYAQAGAGNQALQLTSNGQTINPKLYLH